MAARSLTAEELWRLPRVGVPVPLGGGRVVLPVTTYDIEENRGATVLEVVTDAGESRRITQADARSPAVFAQSILFVRKSSDDRDQLFLMQAGGGEAEQLTRFPLGVIGGKWMPGGEAAVVLAYLLKEHLSLEATAAEIERRKDERFKVHVTEDATYRYWDRWLTTGEVPHLFHLDLATRRVRDLTPRSERWWIWPSVDDPLQSFDISPDGSEIAFTADISDPPHRRLRWGLFTVQVDSGAEQLLSQEVTGHCYRPRYSPDGKTLIYGMTEIPDFYADRVRLVAFDRERHEHRVLTADWDRSLGGWEFDGRGEVVFTAEDTGYRHLYRMGLDGGAPQVLARGGTLSDPVVAADGTVYLLHNSLSEAPEVVRLGAGGTLHPVSSFTKPALAEFELGKVDDLTIHGADGDPLQMFVVFPPGFDPGGTYPLLQLVHGGPHATFGDSWHWRWNVHCFAAVGYVVALVNFHGSTSFGQQYAASIHGAWGDLPYRDIEAATDHLIGLGFVDENRVGVAGGSYGGYLTAFITSQTDRYGVAVAHAAVTDLAGMYASDVTDGRRRNYGAEIWEDVTAVQRWSPSIHAAGYSTPTLVIVGEHDYRVPLAQGLELYGVLKAKGVPARLLYYPEENHWILKPQNSIHWYREVLRWLKLYLK